MEWKDAMPVLGAVIGAVVVVLGWMFSRWKDREHEIFKERLKKRFEMYDSVVAATLPFLNPKDGSVDDGSGDLKNKLETARVRVQLYGYDDEINAFEKFILHLNARDLDGLNESLSILAPLILKKLRLELRYKIRDRLK